MAVGVREQGTVVIADDGELSEAVVLVEVEAGRMALEDLSQKRRLDQIGSACEAETAAHNSFAIQLSGIRRERPV